MTRTVSTSIEPGCVELWRRRRELLGKKRIGLLVNPASVLPDLTYLFDRLIDDASLRLTALLAPEHGLAADRQDQVNIPSATYRGRPVFSLYGTRSADLRPTPGVMDEFDVLVADLQDVGARYYTFIYTIAFAMEACAAAGKPIIICDRPNPLGGLELEGPLLRPPFASFVGRFPLPVRHGLTVGELAEWFNAELKIGAHLTVLPCRGWKRDLWFDQTGLPWVPPSPNMPTADTAIVYPGACLLEGTNLSEGRGTTRPFEITGAPFIDGRELAEKLNALHLPGTAFRPIHFSPTFHKFSGRICGGVFVHVTDREIFRPFRTYLELIYQVCRLNPGEIAWRTEPYEFETERLAFDLLCGTDAIRRGLEAGVAPAELEANWTDELQAFAVERKKYLNPAY